MGDQKKGGKDTQANFGMPAVLIQPSVLVAALQF